MATFHTHFRFLLGAEVRGISCNSFNLEKCLPPLLEMSCFPLSVGTLPSHHVLSHSFHPYINLILYNIHPPSNLTTQHVYMYTHISSRHIMYTHAYMHASTHAHIRIMCKCKSMDVHLYILFARTYYDNVPK